VEGIVQSPDESNGKAINFTAKTQRAQRN